jgi:hypothetical protein
MVNAWFRVDIRHTCDHRVDASMNTMKIPNMVHTMVEWIQMSPWMSSRNISGSNCMLRCEGLKTGFPVMAHEVHTKSSEGIWTRASCDKWNCFICNMFYGLDARVIQSKRWRGYFSNTCSSFVGLIPVEIYISSWRIFRMEIFLRYIEYI